MKPVVIGLTGGIGSGKSVVSRVLRTLGKPVYDCDTEARRLMHDNHDIVNAISQRFGADIYVGSVLDRKRLAETAFSDSTALTDLNAIVHGAVREDIAHKIEEYSKSDTPIIAIESAILFSSGLDCFCDQIWLITADVKIRLKRAKLRNPGQSEADILRRIESQKNEMADKDKSRRVVEIVNEEGFSLIDQIDNLLKSLQN